MTAAFGLVHLACDSVSDWRDALKTWVPFSWGLFSATDFTK
jgi:hypothetical protein